MSSSFRDIFGTRVRTPSAARWTLLAVSAALSGTADAAQTYWQPALEARIEAHTNRDLVPEDEEEMIGYFADLGITWGRETERSVTRIQPRIRIQEFPDRKRLQRTEEFLNFVTEYETLRSEFDLTARFSRRDAYTAEFLQPGFDPVDPSIPLEGGDTGRLLVDQTRTAFSLRPSFTHRVSERNGFSVNVAAEIVDYESSVPVTQVDFKFASVEVAWLRQIDERTSLTFGPFVSRYDADDGGETDAFGARVTWRREWSERSRVALIFAGQNEETTRFADVPVSMDDTSWEALLRLERDTTTGLLRLDLGRSITPSGSGSLSDVDQINLEYRRALSPRWNSKSAVRAQRVRAHNAFAANDDRDTAGLSLSLTWAMTPTWSLSGGYELFWREFVRDNDDALDNAVFLSMTFRGIGPRT